MSARGGSFALGLIVCLVGITLVRAVYFQGLEPRMDQAFVMDWTQSVFHAGHLLPERGPDQSWLEALRTDENSAAYAVLRPIYTASTVLFLTGSLAWFLLGAAVAGTSAAAQFVASIAAHSVMLFFLGLLAWWSRPARDGGSNERLWIGAVAVGLAVFSSFLHVHAPLGYHNVGLMTAMAALIVSGRFLYRLSTEPGFRPGLATLLPVVLMQGLACYTNYANIFLLPVGLGLALLVHPGLGGRRLAALLWFVVLTVLSFAPALALLWITAAVPHDAAVEGGRGQAQQTFAVLLDFVMSGGGRAYLEAAPREWAANLARVLTYPGLALGLLGLVVLAVRHRLALPLAVVAAHFLASVALPQFGRQPDRTFLYAVPLLSLGLAAFAVAAAQMLHAGLRRGFVTAALGGLGVAASLAVVAVWGRAQAPGLLDPTRDPYWGVYFQDQGTFRTLLAGLERHVPPGATVVFWDQLLVMTYRSLADHRGQNIDTFRTFDMLDLHRRQGTLDAYVARRALVLDGTAPLFVLLPGRLSEDAATAAAAAVFCGPPLGYCGQAAADRVDAWPGPPVLRDVYGEELVLYRVTPRPAAPQPTADAAPGPVPAAAVSAPPADTAPVPATDPQASSASAARSP